MSFNLIQKISALEQSWWPYIISFVVSIIISIRVFMAGPNCPAKNRIDNQVVIITGPTSGMGYEITKDLAERGGKIILACRNVRKGIIIAQAIKKTNPGVRLDVRMLDVASQVSVRDFVMDLKKVYKKIDILINNAAVINQSRENEDVDMMLATNYIGAFLLTHLLLPLLYESNNGRIINVAAAAHYSAALNVRDLMSDAKPTFGQTKLALVLFTKHFATLIKGTSITVNAVSPGLVRDTMHYKSLNLEQSFWSKIAIWPWKWLLLKTPRQGAQTIIYTAVEPTLSSTSGVYFSDCEQKEPSNSTKEEALLKEIYETTCTLCGLELNYINNILNT